MSNPICCDCSQKIRDWEYATEINPEGGYGRPRLVVCDPCMRSGRWDEWKQEHWPNWPDKYKWPEKPLRDGC